MPRRKTDPDQLYARWVEHIETIANDVYSLFHQKHMWAELQQMIRAAELPPSVFFESLGAWYASDSKTVAIRRLVDRSAGTISVVRLLGEIANHSTVVTRERHVALWRDAPWLDQQAHENYDRFADRTGDRLDRTLVRADQAAVTENVRVIETYVNDHVAHRAERPSAVRPTYQQMNEAIEAIAEVLRKYASLLRATALVEMEPIIQDDWQAPFRRPWLTA